MTSVVIFDRRAFATPVLMLTAKGETIDKVLGLKLGSRRLSDKTIRSDRAARTDRGSASALANRQRTVIRRMHFGLEPVTIDFKRAEVLRDNEPIDLSAMEFKLLQHLIENRGVVHSRDQLLDAVWGYDAMPSTRTVDVHIAWLRQKLEINPKHPHFIQTVHGMGYKFVN
jgi:two-component system alkaline phosphatase synthesis response regulator PhoP